jgi:betaine-aldehyde dehydrogenase
VTTDLCPGPLLATLSRGANPRLPGALINGAWNEGEGRTIGVVNPATAGVVATFAEASAQQVEQAALAARSALADWRARRPAVRAGVLERIAGALEAERESLASLIRLGNGKPPGEARMDAADAVATFRYYARLAHEWHAFEEEPVELPGADWTARRRYEPCGVAALILPWNFPLVTTAWKLAPALAAGCTVVVKPSELSPLPELAMAEVIRGCGVPEGVLNWVFGGRSVGQALSAAPGIDKISFTGSTAVGESVLRAAASRIARVSLELGGKSALVVFDSADVQQAVGLAVGGIFTNAGQMCSATSRILVQRTLLLPFLERLRDATERLRPHEDDAADSGGYGPLISASQCEKVLAFIRDGIADGLPLLIGGAQPPTARSGYFVSPTVFTDVPSSHPLWRHELFGPVACVRAFDTEQEAIAAANDTEYGLAATVVTGDDAQADRVASALRAGVVWANTPQLVLPEVGWGGFGRSGLGRELGPLGLRAFQEVKHIVGRRERSQPSPAVAS